MPYCWNCGNEVGADAAFCTNCGSSLNTNVSGTPIGEGGVSAMGVKAVGVSMLFVKSFLIAWLAPVFMIILLIAGAILFASGNLLGVFPMALLALIVYYLSFIFPGIFPNSKYANSKTFKGALFWAVVDETNSKRGRIKVKGSKTPKNPSKSNRVKFPMAPVTLLGFVVFGFLGIAVGSVQFGEDLLLVFGIPFVTWVAIRMVRWKRFRAQIPKVAPRVGPPSIGPAGGRLSTDVNSAP